MRAAFLLISAVSIALISLLAFFIHPSFYYCFIVAAPIIALGALDMSNRKHTLIHNYPVVGRLRYVMEQLRPKIYQYFIESDTDGSPLNRVTRSIVYQRAKQDNDTTPFGTQFDIYAPGYEWINHSVYPLPGHSRVEDLKVQVGSLACRQPYSLSFLNISAMSYGALSKTAIEALNWGAKTGDFAHNTGEGGISPYHLKHGGDLIWQIGTAYFGCRDVNGKFDPELFKEQAKIPAVKMIEIKLSQGAKPGHGGILPGSKNTLEIAAIRKVTPGQTIISPPGHNAFSNALEMLAFVNRLRELSEGKPIGLKLCVGNTGEFEDLAQAMVGTGIKPDFITVDGAEGGTGSAPPEFSNSIGMSLRDGLVTVSNTLAALGLRKEVKILCSGKIISGFDVIKARALGADACYSARGMMLALGCIQALECNKNKCPVGITTQKASLYKGLAPQKKYVRVKNYHHGTLNSFAEILAAAGISDPTLLERRHIWRRISFNEIKNFEELYPYPSEIESAQGLLDSLPLTKGQPEK
ncbi:MAG: FMN-binding glutamate synthase family protein [Bacteriovoracaceae bacterium]